MMPYISSLFEEPSIKDMIVISSYPLIHVQVHLDQKACINYFKSYNFLSTTPTPSCYHPYLVINYLHNTH